MIPTKSPDASTEEGIAAASYIIEFYKDCMQVMQWKARYKNTLAMIYTKYGHEFDPNTMEQGDAVELNDTLTNIRYYVDKVCTSYQAISENTKTENANTKKIITAFNTYLETAWVIERTKLDEFTIELNRFLLKDVIKGLLKSSNDLLDAIYGSTSNT